MKYSDGEEVQLGDEVILWQGAYGKVVSLLDSKDFSESYPESDWGYLKSGILIDSPEAGLIHFIQVEPTTKLIRRKNDGS